MTMLPGQSRLAILRISPLRAFSQRASTSTRSSPRMLTMPLGVASAASCMAAPRRCTSISPSSNSITPAKTMAVYSPRLSPAVASQAKHHVGRFGPQRFQRGQAGDEDRRLAVDGRIELVGRPLEAELRQVVAEHVGGAIVQPADAGQRLGQPLAHAHRLCALSGKQKRDSAQDSVSTTLRPM